jgi:hypothetical protein
MSQRLATRTDRRHGQLLTKTAAADFSWPLKIENINDIQ